MHNIIAGKTILNPVRDRYTPYHIPHSTELMGVGNIACGDDRIYNNIYIATDYDIAAPGRPYHGYGLEAYNQLETNLPVFTGSNLYYNGAKPYQHESDSVKPDAFDPGIAIIVEGGSIYLKVSFDEAIEKIDTKTITSESLGIPLMVNHRYENRDGTALTIHKDYFGQARDPEHPTVGPFENPGVGDLNMKVWE